MRTLQCLFGDVSGGCERGCARQPAWQVFAVGWCCKVSCLELLHTVWPTRKLEIHRQTKGRLSLGVKPNGVGGQQHLRGTHRPYSNTLHNPDLHTTSSSQQLEQGVRCFSRSRALRSSSRRAGGGSSGFVLQEHSWAEAGAECEQRLTVCTLAAQSAAAPSTSLLRLRRRDLRSPQHPELFSRPTAAAAAASLRQWKQMAVVTSAAAVVGVHPGVCVGCVCVCLPCCLQGVPSGPLGPPAQAQGPHRQGAVFSGRCHAGTRHSTGHCRRGSAGPVCC